MVRTEIRAKIQALTGCTDLEYLVLQHEKSFDYLAVFTGGNLDIISRFLHTDLYNQWYLNQWDITDLQFLAEYRDSSNDPDIRKWLKTRWAEAHNAEEIKAYPGSHIVAAVWASTQRRGVKV